ncbi:MAG: hypothetical protein IJA61_02745 [Clostridia bacterium]|nr:hypothetical protein [Clostridia bacterium]
MRKKSISAPFEVLVCIVERGVGDKVNEILNVHDCPFHITTLGEGTAASETADIFGFGIVEREVIWALVDPIMSTKILKTLNDVLELEKPRKGIALTIPANAASNLMLDVLGINY